MSCLPAGRLRTLAFEPRAFQQGVLPPPELQLKGLRAGNIEMHSLIRPRGHKGGLASSWPTPFYFKITLTNTK